MTRVFDRNYRSRARFPINVGGARSTKSYSIAQLLVQRLVSGHGRKILVTRKTFPALRLTAYKLVQDMLSDYGFLGRVEHDKVAHTITCPWNGGFMAFVSIDDPEKIKSTEWNDVWMEEASEFDWADFTVLQTRISAAITDGMPNQIFLSLNPTDEDGWINQRVILSPAFAKNIEVIHSTYKDNPFLDRAYVELLEGLEQQDPNAHAIYALGQFGKLTNVIYAPYTVLPEFPTEFDETFYGMDFGFNNPSALLEVNVKDDEFYLRQLIYRTGLTNRELIEAVKDVVPEGRPRRRQFFADAAEPARIEEFCSAGFNVHPAVKDVEPGIDFCKSRKFYTLSANVDLNKERAAYKWKTDKNGNILDDPVKFLDHLMDAKRYGVYSWAKKVGAMPTITVFDHE